MSAYKITPLHLGTITRPKKNFLHGYTGSEVEDFPIIVYHLDGEHKILVDTGGCAVDSEYGQRFQPYRRPKDQELDAALASIGVRPEQIEYVIFTHLHWDHASCNELFPNARFICQRRELASLYEPDNPSSKGGYIKDYVKQFSYELVDGDLQLFDGISVVLTPGHTIGSQSVIVDTDDGLTIISGDLITLQESWYMDPPRSSALYYSEEALTMMYESIDKLRKISTRLLPGHEWHVFEPGMGLR